jgi:hypothetical protein
MSEQTQAKSTTTKRPGRFVLLGVTISLLAVAAVLIWSRFCLPRIEERLAAIEAARAIPDSENAAIVYNRLLEDPDAVSLTGSLGFLDSDANMLTRGQPWLEKDYPELTTWIEEHQWLIDELLAVTQLEKCRFPISIEPYRPSYTTAPVSRARAMRGWVYLLRRAANNDVAEGRIDDAITKWRCLIQLGRHLQQQPKFFELLVGMGYEVSGVNLASIYAVEGDPDEHQLHRIASLPFETKDDWDAILGRIAPVEELWLQEYKKELSFVDRFKYEFGIGVIGMAKDSTYKKIMHEGYSRTLASKRGLRILIALRRYRKEHHRWPESLDVIRPRLPAEILVDPSN